MSVLSQPQFHDEEAAHAFLEGVLWPRAPFVRIAGSSGIHAGLRRTRRSASASAFTSAGIARSSSP